MRTREIEQALAPGKHRATPGKQPFNLHTCTRLQKVGIEELVIPKLDSRCNEHLLLHATSMEHLATILENGLNPGFSTVAAFGAGTYLAEDVAKSNQYFVGGSTTPELQRTFGITPGDNGVFVLLACRVPLGITAHVNRSDEFTDRLTGLEIYANRDARKQFKEPFNSLTVEQTKGGMRFREFVIQTQRAILPVFLILCKRAPDPSRKAGYTLDKDPLKCA